MNSIVHFVISHPWALTLLGIPALLAALPAALRKVETMVFKKLLANGDAIDQRAIRATIRAWTTWAEEKYGTGTGAQKFAVVDGVLAKVLPFLSAEDRKKLIENVLAELDAGAQEAGQDPPPVGAPPVAAPPVVPPAANG